MGKSIFLAYVFFFLVVHKFLSIFRAYQFLSLFLKKKKRNYLQNKNAILNFFFSLLCTINNFFKWFTKCTFSKDYFYQLILLFNLFVLLFMSPTIFFNIIHGFYYTILVNFLPISTVLSTKKFQF